MLREFTHYAFLQDGYPTRRVPSRVLRSVLDMAGVAVLAGSVSTVLFAVSTLPMLIKAARTKELASYSRGNLVLANVGNGAQHLRPAAAGRPHLGPSFVLRRHLGSDAHLAFPLRQRRTPVRRRPFFPPEVFMTIERVETAIIGAGQAGLATAYHLQRRGRSCLILDSNDKVGDNWRAQWDSLRLYSPAQYDGLPGLPFPSPRWSYPTKDEVAAYLSTYAKRFRLPVRRLSKVDRLHAVDGKYVLRHDWHHRRQRRGGDRDIRPYAEYSDFALDLDPSIRQLHSSEYRNPAQLNPGRVLVVGAAHSGTDIALEVSGTHPTVLAGRDTGQVPVRPGPVDETAGLSCRRVPR